jgi:hypothetical protein
MALGYVLFDNAINCRDYVDLMVDKRLSTEHWWNDTDSRKQK